MDWGGGGECMVAELQNVRQTFAATDKECSMLAIDSNWCPQVLVQQWSTLGTTIYATVFQ